jgi:putative hydrolase of HD superfamily
MNELNSVINFFFEMGVLQHTSRSGNIFLGSGTQNVASHVFRTAIIAYSLSIMMEADAGKTVLMALFHDNEETRTGDLNYLQQMYVKSNDEKAIKDQTKGLPFGDKIIELLKEYEKRETVEAKIAKDADTLELIFYLKEEKDKGNLQAQNWIDAARKRLVTDLAKRISMEMENISYYDWWYNIRDDWENGSKKW